MCKFGFSSFVDGVMVILVRMVVVGDRSVVVESLLLGLKSVVCVLI